jgi:hypothetical protein
MNLLLRKTSLMLLKLLSILLGSAPKDDDQKNKCLNMGKLVVNIHSNLPKCDTICKYERGFYYIVFP